MERLSRCAVIGQPIHHSLSPLIHQRFAQQLGMALDYQRIEAAPDDFSNEVAEFFAAGGKGLNVTLPHKRAAAALAVNLTAAAKSSQSVNTLWMDEQHRLCGDSTDGAGLLLDLQRLKFPLRKVLVIGAGGAASAVIAALLQQGSRLYLLNRTQSRAESLLQQFDHQRLSFWQSSDAVELIINCASGGAATLFSEYKDSLKSACVYDLDYGDRAHKWRELCLAAGTDQEMIADGWGMLVQQAALSFKRWHGVMPDVSPLLRESAGSSG